MNTGCHTEHFSGFCHCQSESTKYGIFPLDRKVTLVGFKTHVDEEKVIVQRFGVIP
jgi:hypothetical protein